MEKKKKGIFNKLSNASKKQGHIEKQKKEKKKQLKKNKPRGYGARKAGAIIFWVLFSFMFLFVFVNMLTKSNDEEVVEQEFVESQVTSHSAVEFSKRFVYDLFNVNVDGNERVEKLKSYSNLKLDEAFHSNYKTELNYNDILIKNIEEFENEKARHTFYVKLKTKVPFTDKEKKALDGVEKREVESILAEMLEDDPTIVSISNEEKIRYTELYIVVPIVFNETGFIIDKFPSFTYMDEFNEKLADNPLTLLNKNTDTSDENNVNNFLETFFRSFSSDSVNSISYILDDELYKFGLNDTLQFERINELDLYDGKNDEIIADVDVIFTNELNGLSMKTNYLLVITQRNGKYVVKEVNNDNYIHDLIYNKNSEDDDLDSKENDKNNEGNNNTNNQTDEVNDDSNMNNEDEPNNDVNNNTNDNTDDVNKEQNTTNDNEETNNEEEQIG